MKRAVVYLSVLALLIVGAAPIARAEYDKYWMLHRAGKAVTKLLSPEGEAHGGTGFQIAYRNKQYTVTNDHVCRMGVKKGYLLAAPTFGHVREIKILQRSDETDLCLLEPLPDAPAFQLGQQPKRGSLLTVLGHPLLSTLKESKGKLLKSEKVSILEYIVQDEEELKACTGKKRHLESIFFGLFVGCIIEVQSQKTTVKVKPGNSGSPVLQDRRVVGVLFASDRADNGSIIPLGDLRKFLKAYHEAHQQR